MRMRMDNWNKIRNVQDDRSIYAIIHIDIDQSISIQEEIYYRQIAKQTGKLIYTLINRQNKYVQEIVRRINIQIARQQIKRSMKKYIDI